MVKIVGSSRAAPSEGAAPDQAPMIVPNGTWGP